MPQQTMPGVPPYLLKPQLLSRQIFVPKYWSNYFSPFGKPICQNELPNCQIVELNSFSQIVMPNRIDGSSN
jgi:hypothetical protein